MLKLWLTCFSQVFPLHWGRSRGEVNVVIYSFEFRMLGLLPFLACRYPIVKATLPRADGSGSLTNKYVRVDTRERYDERLQNVFSDFICSEVE